MSLISPAIEISANLSSSAAAAVKVYTAVKQCSAAAHLERGCSHLNCVADIIADHWMDLTEVEVKHAIAKFQK